MIKYIIKVDWRIQIPALYGNLTGLKASYINSIERIYRRKVHNEVVSPELARYLTELSSEIGRQIGILINRDGVITHVIVGDAKGIFIPELEDYPLGRKTLRGLRLVHTHLNEESLSQDDLTDLSLLRLDLIAAIGVRGRLPGNIFVAYLMPSGTKPYEFIYSQNFYDFELDLLPFIESLEDEMERHRVFSPDDKRERAILVSVSTNPRYEQEDSIEELKELAQSSDVFILDTIIQRSKKINPRYLMGEGKIKELIINALNKGATLLIFDQELSPSQIKTIGELAELKVIDRSQLILDIFARRAHSRDGKVQVELAQLKYRLPRLTGKGTAMSRLMGGIGGRGPGEMKLEIDRRRVRERITLLEKELRTLSEARKQRKQKRVEKGISIVSIIGYTNAGKSTLLNSLTKSSVVVEERMFVTLDTASRRLRFPREREVIITDTVGFIRDLPRDLMAAFRATLEELEDADLLLHLVDAANPRFEQHVESVENILRELHLSEKPRLLVFNKIDRLDKEEVQNLELRYNAVAISALDSLTFQPLLAAIEEHIWNRKFIEVIPLNPPLVKGELGGFV
ncbi:MAG: GTPase HflX [Nitrospirae bacterium CG_4_10_14_0_8_um_filter_41_23]|nr:GTPase HflX [Nitrospirota bacterium]PIQ93173.1 MAG: GTPase HflX [Nitrospirae bacterium CG11_big_fil_rev_8_21_14_0_20_41_14]PIV44753.1 MAG: GTPase HflX [Nitrospirae bacterium CG02_land_8_20_14_3_00_41_53]PIW87471.1 MAG: GTPase HflX [Nitrospirae bacterium CG_4_8_14_3_um_filter_41_47]PIY87905.1 MAG: GTPase HflX [Nitrospirae bacterium CG_4_10_14_0_8_um_filter_41_23]PJA78986.1 MAG: GTPase HflX [Nitrospirae bacterium CG_4_9_14_3_um_filter_41_27]